MEAIYDFNFPSCEIVFVVSGLKTSHDILIQCSDAFVRVCPHTCYFSKKHMTQQKIGKISNSGSSNRKSLDESGFTKRMQRRYSTLSIQNLLV